MTYRWTPIFGSWEFTDTEGHNIVFHGAELPWTDSKGVSHADGLAMGLALCDTEFSGGAITAHIKFDAVDSRPSCGLVFWTGPNASSYLIAGINVASGYLFAVRGWDGKAWVDYGGLVGTSNNMRAGHEYEIVVKVLGSSVAISSDGVPVVSVQLPFNLPNGAVGIWCMSKKDVYISRYAVSSQTPKAFVVMQFSTPYNELYEQVIKPVCAAFGLDACRADDTYGPGVIIQDIVREMLACKIVIAEITPTNANVYYEVGYAHALGKPVILVAEAGTKLPFDISPFRVLLYQNTIDGKARIEEGLRRHLDAILLEAKPL